LVFPQKRLVVHFWKKRRRNGKKISVFALSLGESHAQPAPRLRVQRALGQAPHTRHTRSAHSASARAAACTAQRSAFLGGWALLMLLGLGRPLAVVCHVDVTRICINACSTSGCKHGASACRAVGCVLCAGEGDREKRLRNAASGESHRAGNQMSRSSLRMLPKISNALTSHTYHQLASEPHHANSPGFN
jgi:hypothetical protein